MFAILVGLIAGHHARCSRDSDERSFLSKYIKIAHVDELRPGECKTVSAEGRQLALYNVGGCFYVTENRCPHKEGPLGDGQLSAEVVKCPWHDWRFNVITGENTADARVRLRTFEVVIDGNVVSAKIS